MSVIRKHPTLLGADVWIADGKSLTGAKLHFSIIRSADFDKLYWLSRNHAGYAGLDGKPVSWDTVERIIESQMQTD